MSKLAAFTDYENWYLLESIYLGVEFLVASNEVNVSSDGRFEVQCVANGVQKNDITQRTAVEDDLGHSALLGQQVHSTFRWVDALAQCVEFERAVDGHPVGSPPWTRRSLAANFAAARSIREVGRDRNAGCRHPSHSGLYYQRWLLVKRLEQTCSSTRPRQCLAKVPGAVRIYFNLLHQRW